MIIIISVCMLLNYYNTCVDNYIKLYIQINLLESIEFFYISVEIVRKESTTGWSIIC